MHPLLTFGVGLLARFVGLLSEHFSRWVFRQVSEGSAAGLNVLADLTEFCRWFLRRLAGGMCGREERRYGEYDEEAEFYPG